MTFWEKLPKPIIVLAPMADVTDAAFRRIIAECGKPDVTWTEFVSADGLIRATPEGKRKLMRDLVYTESERPIVAQLFSAHPEYMEQAAALVRELGFDGIDINMGCPDKSIERQGAGAAMIKNPENARAVIRAAKRGAGPLPVSVKTRVGYNKVELDRWIPEILSEEPAALTVHARTRKEMSLVPARWEHVAEVVSLRDKAGVNTLVLGNGDVRTVEEARIKVTETGADGAMLGRAIFGNPWLFSGTTIPAPEERLRMLSRHISLFDELLGDIKSYAVMKKHYKAYVSGWDGAKEIRDQLMETTTAPDAITTIKRYLDAFEN